VAGRKFSKGEQTISLNRQERQIARRVGAGVDINTVRTYVRCTDGGMSVNNIFSKALFADEKILADPKQIVLLLLRQGDPRPYPKRSRRLLKKCLWRGGIVDAS